MHKTFLEQAQLSCVTSSDSNPKSAVIMHSNDSDDVYYRFGGAILSALLKLRYQSKKRKGISSAATIIISQEIQVLQSINTKEKSSMPNYLKY